MPSALVLLAEGFEEIETATVVDVLRRAEVDVVLAGLTGSGPVRGSRGMVFVPDRALDEAGDPVDLVVVPGGAEGAEKLADSAEVRRRIREQVKAQRLVGALCAGPLVLDRAGVLGEGAYTCYPGWETRFDTPGRQHQAVVETRSVITSQGPGTAMAFALALVARLQGRARAVEVSRALLHGPTG